MNRIIGLKVDVDTFEGMKHGAPVLQALFEKHGIRGSFFVPMGKDHTGRTVKRVFTRPGFVSKASRTSVLKTYGLKTLLYGLLLPGPEIAQSNGETLRRLSAAGHEIGIHGLDHVYWHDHIKDLDRERTWKILTEAASVYQQILGQPPLSFAAPGWMINAHALAWFEEHGFIYTSDVRGKTPFMPRLEGVTFNVLQIPTTLPTLDEALGLKGNDQESLARFFVSSMTDGLTILTVHAELEGKHWTGFLESFIVTTLARGFRYERLIDVAHNLMSSSPPPVHEIEYGFVEGRAGEVALQK
jgi:undecaprenyl phosphate-alpha-L-ara4FN deformylase